MGPAVLGGARGVLWVTGRPAPAQRAAGAAVTVAPQPAPAATRPPEPPPPEPAKEPDPPADKTPDALPLEDVVSRATPAVVLIETSAGRGSGLFVGTDTIVTNAHVVGRDVSVSLRRA